jgi:hypothetical protein
VSRAIRGLGLWGISTKPFYRNRPGFRLALNFRFLLDAIVSLFRGTGLQDYLFCVASCLSKKDNCFHEKSGYKGLLPIGVQVFGRIATSNSYWRFLEWFRLALNFRFLLGAIVSLFRGTGLQDYLFWKLFVRRKKGTRCLAKFYLRWLFATRGLDPWGISTKLFCQMILLFCLALNFRFLLDATAKPRQESSIVSYSYCLLFALRKKGTQI